MHFYITVRAALPTKLADANRNIKINECRNTYEEWSQSTSWNCGHQSGWIG